MSYIDQLSLQGESSLILGLEAITTIPKQLKMQGKLRPILITDKETKAVVRAFKRQIKGKAWIRAEYQAEEHTATADGIAAITTLFQDAQCDSIIALGTPKAIHIARAFLQHTDKTHKPLLILIPTLPGWGEELTQTLWEKRDSENIEPKSFKTTEGLPQLVVYDTTFLLAMSDRELAITGMNSLVLALDRLLLIGSLKTQPKKDPLVDFQLREGILKIHNNLLLALDCPKEALYRTALLQGISLVQFGMRDTLMGGAEILSRTLSEKTGLPLGLALPFVFPQVLLQAEDISQLTPLFAAIPALGHDDQPCLQKRLVEHLEELKKTLNRKCGSNLPLTLKECVTSEGTPYITPNHFHTVIDNTHTSLDKDSLARTLMAAYWGYNIQQ